MSPEELLPQIQSEEPVTGKGFIAFSRLHYVLGHDGVTEAAVKSIKSGMQERKEEVSTKQRLGV